MKQMCDDCPLLCSNNKEGCMYCRLFDKNIYNQEGLVLDECNDMKSFEKQTIEQLKHLSEKDADPEAAHALADELLVAFIRRLKYNEVADRYDEVQKWFS
jgi:primosomal protein N''